MKELLIIMPNLYNGGAEKSLINFLNTYDRNMYKVDLLLFSKRGLFINQIPEDINVIKADVTLEYTFDKGKKKINLKPRNIYALINKYVGTLLCRIISFNNWNRARQIRWKYFYKYSLKGLNKTYDVAMSFLEGEALYYLVDKVNAKEKIGWFHNDYNLLKYDSRLDKIYFKKLNKIISISERCVEILKENFPEIDEKFHYLPNITSYSMIYKRAKEFIPKEYNYNGIKILSIGRLNYQKGFDLAIEAAEVLKNKGINFKWIIIGDGELYEELIKKVEESKVQEFIYFIGAKENPYPYIYNCDIFVQTSRFEGKSVVIDEAKILGKLIVCTNYPTVYDQIINGLEGIIVSSTPYEIAEGIISLEENKILKKKIQNFIIKNDYGNEHEIERYYEII